MFCLYFCFTKFLYLLKKLRLMISFSSSFCVKNNINKFCPLKPKGRTIVRKPSCLLIFIPLETFFLKTFIQRTNINTVKENEHIDRSPSPPHFQKYP